MSRNLKSLLLAAIAIVAVGVGTASAAYAATFNSESASTILTATGDGIGKTSHHVYDAAGGTLTCGEVHRTGTQVGKSVSFITMTTQLTNCVFLGQAATVSMEACDARFHANGEMDIHKDTNLFGNCKHHEQGITFAVPGCKVIVPEQTGLKTVKYHNIIGATGKLEITMELAISSFTYDISGPVCPKQPAGTYADGAITTGNIIIKGTDATTGLPTNIEWSP